MTINDLINHSLSRKGTFFLCLLVIVFFALFPLFFDFPFRDNIYLSWEGAYRISKGQLPFKDFGIPLGFAYWLIPGLFFKILTPSLFTLIKSQVFINIISGLGFYALARSFSNKNGVVALSVFLYVISFSFYNFWPWYNHTVVVYEVISFAFLARVVCYESIDVKQSIKMYVYIGAAAFFGFLSFYTKQDAGVLAVAIGFVLLLFYSVWHKQFKLLICYIAVFTACIGVFVIPFIQYDFLYWFNYGQFPHFSRVSLWDLFDSFAGESAFIKLYFLLIGFVVIYKIQNHTIKSYYFLVRLFLILGVLAQATIHQVTSYVPADVNIYFHSFAVLFLLSCIEEEINFSKFYILLISSILIFTWWSGRYWDYGSRILSFLKPDNQNRSEVVSKSTYTMGGDSNKIDISKWKLSNLKFYEGIKLPEDNISAIAKIQSWNDSIDFKPKVLNMSEHTPLLALLDLELSSGDPLWYHYHVALHGKELEEYKDRIRSGMYDLVLFEYIPHLNNFYPFEVRDELQKSYKFWFEFQAPRDQKSEVIEVYLKER